MQRRLRSPRGSNQKSLKLQVVLSNANVKTDSEPVDADEKEANTEASEPLSSEKSAPAPHSRPSREDVEAFLGDETVLALLPDLVLDVLSLMEESSFSVPLMECVQAVLLSNEEKFAKMRASPVWPLFVDELLPSVAPKIEFFAQMMRANGQSIDIAMVRQWMPTIMGALRMRFGGGCRGGRRGWRGGHCGRGRGGFRGHRGGGHRGRWGHRGHHGHHGHRGHRGGHRGHRGGFGQGHGQGFNPWFQPPQPQQQSEEVWQPKAEPRGAEEQIEAESNAFEYTEELVAIMNMGFGDMASIKQLLVEHKGNKQRVVQALVSNSK